MFFVAVLGGALLAAAALSACATATKEPAPAPEPVPEFLPPVAEPAPPAEPPKLTTYVTITAAKVNVRSGPGTQFPSLTKASKGDRLELAGEKDGWMEIRLPGARAGFVSSKFARREAPCAPDSPGPQILARPTLSFSDGGAHGAVQLRISVAENGDVTAVKVVSNGTGDPALAEQAVAEAQQLKFAPLVRRCRPIAFTYLFTRSF